MKPPERGALLSISASAARTFFDQDTIKGLRIRTVGDVVSLKGAATTAGANVVAVEQRGRGGLSAMVSGGGTNSPEFFRLLRRSGFRTSAPFFLLTELPREWVGIKHWKKANAPLNQPYIRVWLGEATTGRGRKTDRQEEGIDWHRLRRVLTEANRIMTRRGRVPRDMEMSREQARRDLEQFERLIAAVLPERGNPEVLQARLERAIELREGAERQRDAANDERDAVMEELAAVQRVLDRERRGRRTETTTDEAPRRRPGGRRQQFVVHTEPQDHVATEAEPPTQEPDEHIEQHNEPVETLAEEQRNGDSDVLDSDVVSEAEPEAEPAQTDEAEPAAHETEHATSEPEEIPPEADPLVPPDTEQPPTEGIEFPEPNEDQRHHE